MEHFNFSTIKKKRLQIPIEILRKINRLLFNYYASYIYSFIAGILVSISINLLTSLPFSVSSKLNLNQVYFISFSLLLSAIGTFGISANLEIARKEWERGGATLDEEAMRDRIDDKIRIKTLWFFFLLVVQGLALLLNYKNIFFFFS